MEQSSTNKTEESNEDQSSQRIILSLERKLYDLKNLIELGLSLSSNLDFENLVESILYSCIGQMFVEKVAILLQRDIDENNYYIHMAKGFDHDFQSPIIMLKDNSPIVTYFEKNAYPQEFEHLTEFSELHNDLKTLAPLQAELIVPLKSKNSLNGLLTLSGKINGGGFSDHEKEFLTGLAKFSAIAVENSRLYLMATLDRMTRLYIHHYFQERLNEEVIRYQRYGTGPLSLIMIDIDHFKKFNDTYGHQQGDTVLKEVARLIKEQIRKMDLPARYGGEEFAIILPETDLEAAVLVANRLRKKVEMHEFPGQETPLHVTISLGVAEFSTENDKSKEALIKKADDALYRAKESGRNRVGAHR